MEGPSKNALKHEAEPGPRQLTGRTQTDHIVVFDGNERLAGQIVRVAVEEATAFTLFGTVIRGVQVGTEQDGLAATVRPPPAEQELSGHRLSLPLIG